MHTLDFWFDPVSPYAALAFARLPHALEGLSVQVRYRPVLFAGLLRHWGQLGPAEIGPKRDWTYRQVLWQARELGLPLQLPARHPFNPLALLRLAFACASPAAAALAREPDAARPAVAPAALPNRRVVQALFDHVWQGAGDAEDPQRLAALVTALAPARDPQGDEVKQALRASTEAAIAQGVFGVPTIQAAGRTFFGLDALPMLAQALAGDPWFDGAGWTGAGEVGAGTVRSRGDSSQPAARR